eukprot:11550711-Karenia_brevis.AAC.1
MIDYCQDALKHYRKCTGLKEFKRANSPFCPDGSLPAADEEVQGALACPLSTSGYCQGNQ